MNPNPNWWKWAVKKERKKIGEIERKKKIISLFFFLVFFFWEKWVRKIWVSVNENEIKEREREVKKMAGK